MEEFVREIKAVKDYEKAAINWEVLEKNEVIGSQ